MSVRQSLLAILAQGPCYGYQLRAEFDRRTGSAWPLNVGQVYTTLDRLERDGLVTTVGADDQGHVVYEITAAGREAVADWWDSPLDTTPGSARDELAVKLAVAVTLPGVDAREVLAVQRTAAAEVLSGLRSRRAPAGSGGGISGAAAAVVLEAQIARAEAEAVWLDRTADILDAADPSEDGLPLDTQVPRRGRPARA
jgi:DNA-binding PadR family transcriptional regulator